MRASLFTDTRAGMLAAARNRDDPTEVTSLTAWITGDTAAALDRLPPRRRGARRDRGDRALRPAAQRPARAASACIRGAPTLTPRGAWAYFRPGRGRRASRRARARRTAGCTSAASTCDENRGMEGAMESAEEAAAAILENV